MGSPSIASSSVDSFSLGDSHFEDFRLDADETVSSSSLEDSDWLHQYTHEGFIFLDEVEKNAHGSINDSQSLPEMSKENAANAALVSSIYPLFSPKRTSHEREESPVAFKNLSIVSRVD